MQIIVVSYDGTERKINMDLCAMPQLTGMRVSSLKIEALELVEFLLRTPTVQAMQYISRLNTLYTPAAARSIKNGLSDVYR